LLANAGDMSQTTQVLPAFATILSELGPVEVRILDWYFNNLTGHGTRNTYLTTSGQAMCPINTQTLYFKQFNLDAETAGAIDFNLRRLELIELWDTRSGAVILPEEAKLLPGALPDGTRMFNAQIVTTDNSHRVFTPLGYLFVKACLPPGTPDPQERFRQVGKERHPGQS
jgi:hypothetical protein